MLQFNTVAVLNDENPIIPANPTADEWYDCGNDWATSKFYFTLPSTDIEGNPIDPTKLSYSIFLDDDQIYTFDYWDYDYDIEDDMTEIPYSIYSDGYDITDHVVYFYGTNYSEWPIFTWRIGIQVYYTYHGVKTASDIVYLEVFPNPYSGVEEMNADKTVASVRYYNMAGQEMAQPQGLAIKVTTYSDGTSSTVKVMK